MMMMVLMISPTDSQDTDSSVLNKTELMDDMRADWWDRSYTRQQMMPEERYYMNQVTAELLFVFTARCTLVQSAVLRSHVVRLSVRLSVCLSVTLVDQDHIGSKSWKLIARTLSPTPSLFGA